jgi:pheromone alpha factor receptor
MRISISESSCSSSNPSNRIFFLPHPRYSHHRIPALILGSYTLHFSISCCTSTTTRDSPTFFPKQIIMSDRYACSELSDPNFNPRKQCITLFYPDGSNTSVPLVAMNEIRVEGIQWTIMFSTQIGACGILLIIFALLTSSKKRKTALFIINMLALICAIVRAVLAVQWYLGPIHDIYRYMAYDFSDIGMAPRWVSVFSTTSGLALQMFIHLSLILQLRVVYSSTPKLNMAITLLACALALTSTGLYFKWTVMNNMANLALISYAGDWVYGTAKQLFAACITFYSFIFLLKLGYAIRQRRVLGLRSFGAMQIIFTMACQTMILPGK